jgi:hypothetical protein
MPASSNVSAESRKSPPSQASYAKWLAIFSPPFAVEGSELFVRQLDIDGGNILFQVHHLRRPRNGERDRTTLENPGERDLARSGRMGLGDRIANRIALDEVARSQRIPGDEPDAAPLAIIQHVFAAAIDEVIAILHRRHFENLRGGFDVGDGNVT